jgi:hypothetical protein
VTNEHRTKGHNVNEQVNYSTALSRERARARRIAELAAKGSDSERGLTKAEAEEHNRLVREIGNEEHRRELEAQQPVHDDLIRLYVEYRLKHGSAVERDKGRSAKVVIDPDDIARYGGVDPIIRAIIAVRDFGSNDCAHLVTILRIEHRV